LYPIIVPSKVMDLNGFQSFKENPYNELVKYVVDIEKEIIAFGGEMHADAEKVLLNSGSEQENLWGANIYPWKTPVEIEYLSLINIRPICSNFSMEIKDDNLKKKVLEITKKWVGFL
jgi:hypothetical protein